MISYTDQIKAAVTMPEVCAAYGIEVDRKGFCKCPFHQEKTGSMKIYPDGYKCYGCGAAGDQIAFVQQFFNLSFSDAQKKLNDDFRLGLPIGERLTDDKRREAERAARERQKQVQERKQARERLQNAYNRALDWWVYLDMVKRENAPRGITDGFCAEYAWALKKLPVAEYRLSCAEIALYKFDHSEESA